MAIEKVNQTSEKLLARLKGLREHLQPGEIVILNVPAIWDGGENHQGTPCDVVVTNQRVLGFYARSFPRERLFLDSVPLTSFKAVSYRQKTNEPLFRELLLNTGERKIYIRAPRKRIEELYAALRAAIEEYAPEARSALADKQETSLAQIAEAPVFGRQEIKTPFESSSLGITLLFVGGFVLELLGILFAYLTGSLANGIPLFIAGLVAYLASLFLRRRRNSN